MKSTRKNLLCLIAIFAMFLTACEGPSFLSGEPQPEFDLHISYVDAEESEDANWTKIEIVIEGYKIDYTWEYGGYHPNENFDRFDSESKKMSSEEYLELVLLIDEYGLASEVIEDSPYGMGDSVEMSLDMFLDGESTHSEISGMSSLYPFDTETPSIENTEYLKGVDRLIGHIKDILDF